MICPNCHGSSADDATTCVKCGAMLQTATTAATASARKSRKAVASFILGIVGLIGIIFLGFQFWSGALLMFLSDLGLGILLLALLFMISCLLAILLGKKASHDIWASSRRLAGIGLARAGILLGACNIVLALVLVVAAWHCVVVPEIQSHSRWRTDTRSLSVAIAAYYIDHKVYPAWGVGAAGPGGTWTYNYWVASLPNTPRFRPTGYFERKELGPFFWYKRVRQDSNPSADLPCFALRGKAPGQAFQTLTTPQSYITSYPADPFSPIQGATFVYWSVRPGAADPSGKIVGKDSPTSGVGWILVSPGPDRKYDIPDDWDVYDPSVAQPSERLLTGTNRKGYAFTYDPTNGTFSHGDFWRVKQ